MENKTKRKLLFEEINKIDKTINWWEKNEIQITNFKNERSDITTDATDILKDNMEILSLLCIYNLDDNVNGKFLQRHKLLKFTKERVDLNSSISIKEM